MHCGRPNGAGHTMPWMKTTSRSLAREEGFTLPELLMAAALLIGLLAVMAASLTVVAGTQPRIADRSAQIQEGRAMIERLTRELREGSNLQAPTASSLSFLTFVRTQTCDDSAPPVSSSTPAIQCQVTYVCTDGTCTRQQGTGIPVELVDGLRSSQVFSYSPTIEPNHVTVTLEYPGEDGGESVTFRDGAALRNATG
jgi:type II secretory pathway pseudopilin PulG